MNKQGASVLLLIGELMVVIIAIFLITDYAQGLATSETTQKIIIAEDMRMMINTLVGIPGNAVVEYPHNASRYSFILNSGAVAVFVPGEPENKWAVRTFILPQGYTAEGVAEKSERRCLEKEGKIIRVRECKPNEP